jgi:phage terminase large subunit-like protein
VPIKAQRFQRSIEHAIRGPERELLISLPRGNGKTFLLAKIALDHLLAVEDARVVVIAASRQQAAHLFRYADEMARETRNSHLFRRYLVLRWCPDPLDPKTYTRSLEVWPSADPGKLHGMTFSLGIVDELQAHLKDGAYLALASALHKRPDAKLVTISTAGQGVDSPLGQLRARAMAQPKVRRKGFLTDARGPGFRMLEWSLPEDADVDDPKVVKKVNPASWITVPQLREQRERLPDLAYRRYVCNQWTEVAGHWLPPGAYQEVVGQPVIEDGAKIFVGVDVGGQGTLTAVDWLDQSLNVGSWTGRGEDAVLDARDLIHELAERFTIEVVAFDPWRAGQLAAELERDGLTCVAVPQTDSRMIPASDRLNRAILEKRITLPDDDELRAASARAVAKTSRRGWRIDGDDIGPLIALAIALDEAEAAKPEPTKLLGWL